MLRSGGFMPHAVPRTAAAVLAARRIPVKSPVDAQEETHAPWIVRTALMPPSTSPPDPARGPAARGDVRSIAGAWPAWC